MRNRITLIAATAVLVCSASLAFAQTPPAATKPGPEVKRLGAFVGKWIESGDMKAGPMGPGGKFTGTDNCEWTAGGFGVLCHETSDVPGMGKSTGTALIFYDDGAKQYVYSDVGGGMTSVSHGKVDGDTWTWNSEGMMGGQNFHQRFTMKMTSKDSFDFTFEMGADANSLSTAMTGTEKRAMPAAAKPATK
jgi:hypothetical protein